MNNRPSWDEYFLALAYFASTRSEDINTHVGAVIVSPSNEILATGYNGLPRGLKTNDVNVFNKPDKYHYFQHAESNAIAQIARSNNSSVGARIYTTLFPCVECARLIIQSGITEVIIHRELQAKYEEEKNHWVEAFSISKNLFKLSNVKINEFDGIVRTHTGVLINGKRI